jgi:Holliday junction resolvase RusA-like endonuclease
MRGRKIIDTIVVGRVSVWANPPYESQWKNKIVEKVKPLVKAPARECSLKLEFYIPRERLRTGNDVDNLAKPVMDALKAAHVILDDPYVFNLEVTKFPVVDVEKMHIELWEWIV